MKTTKNCEFVFLQWDIEPETDQSLYWGVRRCCVCSPPRWNESAALGFADQNKKEKINLFHLEL